MGQMTHSTPKEESDSLSKKSFMNTYIGKIKSNRKMLRWIIVVAIIFFTIVGSVIYIKISAYESTDDAYIEGKIIPISARVSGHVARVYITDNIKVKTGDLLLEIDDRDFTARLNAARAALHSAQADSRSREIDVKLITTSTSADVRESKADVEAAQAMVQNAQALSDAAKNQYREAQAQLTFAKASLNQAQAELIAEEAKYQQSSTDLKSYRKLAENHTISKQNWEQVQTAERVAAADRDAARSKVVTQQSMLQQAKAALEVAQNNVRQAETQVSARKSQMEQANARLASANSAPEHIAQSNSKAEASKADLEKAQAEVEQAVLNLSYTKIRAPISGYVTQKNVEAGAFVQVGQSLTAVVSPKIWITANFKETQLRHMCPGQPATITVDTYPNMTFHGHVQSIQHGTGSRFSLLPPQNATGNFVKVVQRVPVKIIFDQPQELANYLLVPGMSVVPAINIKAQTVPIAAKRQTDAPHINPQSRKEQH
jgi:membrane fusion protein (multidrug efflux system)